MASTNMDEHDYAPRRSDPPTDSHVLVLLTAFEMYDPDEIIDNEVELADVCDLSVYSLYPILHDLTRTGWVTYSHYPVGWFFTDEQACVINHRYPSALDN